MGREVVAGVERVAAMDRAESAARGAGISAVGKNREGAARVAVEEKMAWAAGMVAVLVGRAVQECSR